MKTKFTSLESVSRSWHLVDAKDAILGRMASKIAAILRGKHKPMFAPHTDTGDFVVVVNAAGVRLTGTKAEKKVYWTHSGYFGSIKSISFAEQIEKDPTKAIEHAIKGMLPKGPLGRKMFKKLKVYTDQNHPHQAQNPISLGL